MHKELGFSPPFLPDAANNKPPYLAIGGTRKKEKSKSKTKSKTKTKTKETRKVKGKKEKSLEHVAKLFSKVWKSIGKA